MKCFGRLAKHITHSMEQRYYQNPSNGQKIKGTHWDLTLVLRTFPYTVIQWLNLRGEDSPLTTLLLAAS